MAEGCKGLQFYVDVGRMMIVRIYTPESGQIRETFVFPGIVSKKARAGLRDAHNAQYHLYPNFCPACGAPFVDDEPSCTGRLADVPAGEGVTA